MAKEKSSVKKHKGNCGMKFCHKRFSIDYNEIIKKRASDENN